MDLNSKREKQEQNKSRHTNTHNAYNLPRKTVAIITAVCSTGSVRFKVTRNSWYDEKHK